MRAWLLPRRRFLAGAGGTMVSLPLLEAMLPTDTALAQTAAMPRFVFLFFPNGTVRTEMSPPSMDALAPVLAPLAPLRSDLLFVEGLHNRLNSSWRWYAPGLGDGSAHELGAPTFLTCSRLADKAGLRVSISADQLIGQELQRRQGTRLASLVIGDGRTSTGTGQGGVNQLYQSLMSWRSDKANDYAAPLTRPSQVFSEIFAGAPPAGAAGTPGAVDPRIAALQARRRSILDAVKEQEAPMRQRLGRADVARLDQFFTSLREVEKKVALAGAPGAGGARCERPAAPADTADFTQVTRTMIDLAVLALQCRVAPCVCYQLSRANNGVRTGSFAGVSEDQHGISHHGGNPASMEKLRRIVTWYNQQLAAFVERLRATQELGGPLLRNVATVYGSEVSDADGHVGRDLPIVLAGGQALGIRTGGILDVGFGKAGGGDMTGDSQRAAPLANLFLSLARLAGVPATSFGNSTGTFGLAPNRG